MKTNSRAAAFPTLLLLIGPAFILFTAFVVVPVVQAAVYSLYKWNGMGPFSAFRGLANFVTLFPTPPSRRRCGTTC